MPTTIPISQLRGVGITSNRYQATNADATVIHTELAGPGGLVLAAAFTGVQNDIPRNLYVVDNGVGAGNAGNVVVAGFDQWGMPVTETIAITNLGTSTANVAFTLIQSITFPVIGDTSISVQQGSRVGVAVDLTVSLVNTVAKNGVFMPSAAFTLVPVYGTIEETGVPLVAADVYEYYVNG